MLYPEVDMAQVEAKLLTGMAVIRDKAVALQRETYPNGDHSMLLSWVPNVDFQWESIVDRLSQAVWNTAHARYVDWYNSNGNPKRIGTSRGSRATKRARKV